MNLLARDELKRRARDLVDLAAVQTVCHGGEVYAAPNTAEVPGGGPVAALFRF